MLTVHVVDIRSDDFVARNQVVRFVNVRIFVHHGAAPLSGPIQQLDRLIVPKGNHSVLRQFGLDAEEKNHERRTTPGQTGERKNSFSFRRMTRGQVWALAMAAVFIRRCTFSESSERGFFAMIDGPLGGAVAL